MTVKMEENFTTVLNETSKRAVAIFNEVRKKLNTSE